MSRVHRNIDISNKSYGEWVTRLADVVSNQDVQIGVELTYNSDATYIAEKAAALAHTESAYTVEFASTTEVISANFIPSGWSDAAPRGGKVASTLTYFSSGVVIYTPATAS